MSRGQIEIDARKSMLRRGVLSLVEQGEPLEIILTRLIENIEAQSERMLAALAIQARPDEFAEMSRAR